MLALIQLAPLVNLILTLLGGAQAAKWALRTKSLGGAVAKISPRVVKWARGGGGGRVVTPAMEALSLGQMRADEAPALSEGVRRLGRGAKGVLQRHPVAAPTLATIAALSLGRGAGQQDKQQALEMIGQLQGMDGDDSAEGLRAQLLLQLLEQANMNRGGE